MSTQSSSASTGRLELEECPPPRSFTLHIVFLALALGLAFYVGAYAGQHSTKPPPVGPFTGEQSTLPGQLVVHVAGEVNRPGVYELPAESRVRDAVRKAGGVTPTADLNAINLAAWAEDAQKIEVPRQAPATPLVPAAPVVALPSTPLTPDGDASPDLPWPAPDPAPEAVTSAPSRRDKTSGKTDSSRNRNAEHKVRSPRLPEVPRASTPTGEDSQNADPAYLAKHPLDLNRATPQQLELLPSIGPAMAAKIVAARQEKGSFKTVDELDDVPGIGEKTLVKLRPLVTVK